MKKIILLCFFTLTACDQSPSEKTVNPESTTSEVADKSSTVTSRWYTQSQLEVGYKIYQKNCLRCHNKDAVGTLEWKKTRPNGDYPPPPLNGTAHAWHHDIGTLTRTIKNGGIPLGGVMPGFSNQLSDAEIRAVIAYFQSFWSNEIYDSWLEIGGL